MMKIKLARLFYKSGAFILASAITVLSVLETILQTLPPEVMGEWGVPALGMVTAVIAFIRAIHQPNMEGGKEE